MKRLYLASFLICASIMTLSSCDKLELKSYKLDSKDIKDYLFSPIKHEILNEDRLRDFDLDEEGESEMMEYVEAIDCPTPEIKSSSPDTKNE